MMGLHGTLMVGIFSKTDAGPSSKMIQDEKYIRGIIPEVEEEMLEQGKWPGLFADVVIWNLAQAIT